MIRSDNYFYDTYSLMTTDNTVDDQYILQTYDPRYIAIKRVVEEYIQYTTTFSRRSICVILSQMVAMMISDDIMIDVDNNDIGYCWNWQTLLWDEKTGRGLENATINESCAMILQVVGTMLVEHRHYKGASNSINQLEHMIWMLQYNDGLDMVYHQCMKMLRRCEKIIERKAAMNIPIAGCEMVHLKSGKRRYRTRHDFFVNESVTPVTTIVPL